MKFLLSQIHKERKKMFHKAIPVMGSDLFDEINRKKIKNSVQAYHSVYHEEYSW